VTFRYPSLTATIGAVALIASVSLFASPADAGSRTNATVTGAAIGAGIGLLVDGGRGATRGAVAGALIGNVSRM
jgi:hypothetical protein